MTPLAAWRIAATVLRLEKRDRERAKKSKK